MRILLTGGTGFIGSRVLQLLCADNDVTVLVRASSVLPADFPENVAVYRIDTLEAPFSAETDVLVHLAGKSKWGNLETAENLFESLNIMDNLLHSVTFKRFVFVSSAAAALYDGQAPEELYYYALAKKINERKVQQLSNYAILRPGEVYGIDPAFITAGNLITLRDSPFASAGRVSVCSVDEIARGIVSASVAVDVENGIFELGGQNASIRQIGMCVRKSFNKLPICIAMPAGVVRFGSKYFSKLLNIEPEAAKYSVFDWSQDSSKAVESLGYKIFPYTQIVEGVCAWLKSIGK